MCRGKEDKCLFTDNGMFWLFLPKSIRRTSAAFWNWCLRSVCPAPVWCLSTLYHRAEEETQEPWRCLRRQMSSGQQQRHVGGASYTTTNVHVSPAIHLRLDFYSIIGFYQGVSALQGPMRALQKISRLFNWACPVLISNKQIESKHLFYNFHINWYQYMQPFTAHHFHFHFHFHLKTIFRSHHLSQNQAR